MVRLEIVGRKLVVVLLESLCCRVQAIISAPRARRSSEISTSLVTFAKAGMVEARLVSSKGRRAAAASLWFALDFESGAVTTARACQNNASWMYPVLPPASRVAWPLSSMLLSMRRARSWGDEDRGGDGDEDPLTAWRAARMAAVICFARMMMMDVYVLRDRCSVYALVFRSG